MVRIQAILVVALLTLTACTGTATTAPRLNGTTWIVSSITGQATASSQRPTLAFNDGRVTGSTGCNTLSGAYTQNGDGVTFSPMAVTQMACDETAMAQQTAFLAAVNKVSSATGDPSTVTLRDATGATVLTLTPPPTPSPTPSPLAGTTWKLESIAEGTTARSPIAGTTITLTVNTTAGSYSGTACQTFGGDVSVSGSSITFAVPHTTQLACSPEATDQASDVLSLLPQVKTWQITGDTLTLSTPHDTLKFVAS